MKVFQQGMPVWKQAKGLVVSEPDYVTDMMKKDASYVLIDLRSEDEAVSGHIPGTVSLPKKRLSSAKGMFPDDMSAPIILYTSEGIDHEAFSIVRSWGYRNASVMRDGLAGWKASGSKVAIGAPKTRIVYVKKTPKGQISIDEFTSVIKTAPADKIILDVRDKDTADAGMIQGAVNIPYRQLKGSLGRLPKDKEVLIYCNTGILASMAARALREKGFRARHLDAIVQVDKDGRYEITEK